MIQFGIKEKSVSINNNSGSSANSHWNSSTSTPHMAGNVQHFVCHANNNKSLSPDMWILDSGATDHITPHMHFSLMFIQLIQLCTYQMVTLQLLLMLGKLSYTQI